MNHIIQVIWMDTMALPDTKFPQVLNVVPIKYEAYFSFHLFSFFDRINNDKVS